MTAKEKKDACLIRPYKWREIGCACAVIVDGKQGYIPAAMCSNCQKPVIDNFLKVNYCPYCGAKITERIGVYEKD